jgi:hypothetical protein
MAVDVVALKVEVKPGGEHELAARQAAYEAAVQCGHAQRETLCIEQQKLGVLENKLA